MSGGFAHVYLVRTATPVYNTTHHVLKRIAVANEAMLTEVKKEVDVMRLLKGHPNIVHLIDAAWHKMPNDMYEVFILMEFCPGGGIIDMMNRRLRERLTEAEILQIFVDVCEGVACMHNLRPALLHRDLKVENILQSSPTSYKLCDFGSATIVSRPPASTQEIRALEAELNRHTTLQYRAPEMVDVYSRRPVDEKSDVWALGVLLYKLCYYTTPFEEHGQLAILNVQYRIPPYPVYSPQMNQLIASMLQEHGVRRPSVFELLSHVHRLRGTKSRFKYTIPMQPQLSPRQQTHFRPSASPNHIEHMGVPPFNRVSMSVSPSKGQGVQAREKVMEAIAPLRRGEQAISADHGSSSASPDHQNVQPMRRGRPSIKESKSSVKPPSYKPSDAHNPKPGRGSNWLDDDLIGGSDSWRSMAVSDARGSNGSADVWNINGKELKADGKTDKHLGFGDDFAEKLWDSVGGSKPEPHVNSMASSKSTPPTRQHPPLGMNRRSSPDKDAFEGLGLGTSSQKPAPTLAEARKLRTGLATMNSNGFQTNDKSGNTVSRLTPSPRQPPSQSQLYLSSVTSSSPNLLGSTSSKLPPQPVSRKSTPVQLPDGLPAESRFPSLEELDASFPHGMPPNPSTGSPSYQVQEKSSPLSRRNGVPSRPTIGDVSLLKPDLHPRSSHGREGTRSEQVTGIAMRESRGGSDRRVPVDSLGHEEGKATSGLHPGDENDPSLRPSLTRKHRSSVAMKHPFQLGSSEAPAMPSTLSNQPAQGALRRVPTREQPKDWLTGEEDLDSGSQASSLASAIPGETAVLRDSPSKRASVIQRSTVPLQDAVVAQHDHVLYARRTPSPSPTPSTDPQISPTLSRFTCAFPPIDTSEDSRRELGLKRSPVLTRTSRRPQDIDSMSSGEEEGPEDAAGGTRPNLNAPRQRRSHKGRQSSVHDLVDLYGGGLGSKEKERDLRSPAINPDSSHQRLKGRTTGTTLASANSSSNPHFASSHTLLSPVTISASSRQPPPSEQRNAPPSSGPPPSPSRSRPQSMFIFPSKSTDSYTASSAGQSSTTPGLAPPEGAKHRTTIRRTSISDMVQRYEGFGSGVKSAGQGGPLSPGAARPVLQLASTNDSRYLRGQATVDKDRGVSTLPVSSDFDSGRPPRSSADLHRTSPAPHISTPVPIQHDTFRKESEDIIPRNTSLKPESSRPRFPSRKATDDSSSRTESGSSSPERPYQGVGKLIDQWQRKTAEVEPSRTALKGRGTFIAKRP
ncbi:hypothetical protein D9615_001210 [Tricholomella constricta]|uniref:non-specific serine/threonine protein kinase n=1 Tax=Tricholomella constricta TaxID=117010 RepID=A0A8H5HKG5_9AGAR|nr:hypothetical protein D9615_001210 [Tricholomella constricta]